MSLEPKINEVRHTLSMVEALLVQAEESLKDQQLTQQTKSDLAKAQIEYSLVKNATETLLNTGKHQEMTVKQRQKEIETLNGRLNKLHNDIAALVREKVAMRPRTRGAARLLLTHQRARSGRTFGAADCPGVYHMDFWGNTIEELQLTSALQANLALAGADVVIAGIPAGSVIIRVIVMFLCRAIENTNAAANKLNGAQNIEVNFGGGAFADAINFADDLFGVAAITREMGTVVIGDNDMSATVTGNGTCTFRIDAARADQNNLNFNDYQMGVRVYFRI